MNINFTPAVRKTVLGGVAALAIAGGAMVGINKNNTKDDSCTTEQYLEALGNLNKSEAEIKMKLDSIVKTMDPSDKAKKELLQTLQRGNEVASESKQNLKEIVEKL